MEKFNKDVEMLIEAYDKVKKGNDPLARKAKIAVKKQKEEAAIPDIDEDDDDGKENIKATKAPKG